MKRLCQDQQVFVTRNQSLSPARHGELQKRHVQRIAAFRDRGQWLGHAHRLGIGHKVASLPSLPKLPGLAASKDQRRQHHIGDLHRTQWADHGLVGV